MLNWPLGDQAPAVFARGEPGLSHCGLGAGSETIYARTSDSSDNSELLRLAKGSPGPVIYPPQGPLAAKSSWWLRVKDALTKGEIQVQEVEVWRKAIPDGLILGLWHQDPGKSPSTEQFVHVGSFDL